MDTNQVGSINFDANNLYLEDESEHELDDKQQENEVKPWHKIYIFWIIWTNI